MSKEERGLITQGMEVIKKYIYKVSFYKDLYNHSH